MIPVENDEMTEQAKAELLDAGATADVMVVLLSSDVFQGTVDAVWDELVTEIRGECLTL